ncbi:DNA-binding LytR/AlgR family response regulator [Dyadobacter jejuensis]|uniref:DNA-binding LytR/AlgR family response regulator n=1 Tax=Dyadobacter jejuensis TaxID=1082580 RepID=A0A316AJA7_9BACT|nr:LytTR family DNA-binding domain-containing protein [Dyadobacter jejuensis]PWJ57895.1 DNA-binding LytR/AlgR family response regulator [Dyadobacter jejuensis]
MDKIKCIAIDDEPFALELISEDIQRLDFLELVGSFPGPDAAGNLLKEGEVDLIFLDIQMPTITGIEFLKSTPVHPMVILTTAYEQYALDGFELNVVDYLVKPIPFTRFQQAAERALNLFQLNKLASTQQPLPPIYVNTQYQKVKIAQEDISYVEGMKDYVKIYIENQSEPILTRMNLKKMESLLSPERFCRVHNSFVVPLEKITSSLRSKLFLGSVEIPIGEKFAEHFRERYQQ